ncbi:hypothetical protein GCM10012284_10580 [Mangrovihabitans endophyticus]|uniref:Uncharacterized protein n=1 Tax=Mangrovihabitans endophyticus TaxID=1751298 RepID=A0A8J3FMT0_9ACTN|nr:hypothetical protein [Mangrovihabitans endophyticus]GGK78562.1 hypothetical protein GCM10012284_10580 [Mangrovihabitans endophyticus]
MTLQPGNRDAAAAGHHRGRPRVAEQIGQAFAGGRRDEWADAGPLVGGVPDRHGLQQGHQPFEYLRVAPAIHQHPAGDQGRLRRRFDQRGDPSSQGGGEVAQQEQQRPVPRHDERGEPDRFADQMGDRAIGQDARSAADDTGEARVVGQRVGRGGDLLPRLADRFAGFPHQGVGRPDGC